MRKLLVLLSLCCLTLFTGCQANDKNLATKKNGENKIPTTKVIASKEVTPIKAPEVVGFSGKMSQIYETIGSLQKGSSLILEGEVVANEYKVYEGITFTISSLKVNDVVKGNNQVQNGETIKVLQTGGISSFTDIPEKDFISKEEREKFLKENEGKKIELVFEESPVIKEQQKVIIFLQEYVGPIGDDLYVATGDFQGRFIVDQNTVKAQNKFLKEEYKKSKEDFKNYIRTLETK